MKNKKDRNGAIARRTGGKVGEPIEGVVNGPVGATRLAAILRDRLRQSVCADGNSMVEWHQRQFSVAALTCLMIRSLLQASEPGAESESSPKCLAIDSKPLQAKSGHQRQSLMSFSSSATT